MQSAEWLTVIGSHEVLKTLIQLFTWLSKIQIFLTMLALQQFTNELTLVLLIMQKKPISICQMENKMHQPGVSKGGSHTVK